MWVVSEHSILVQIGGLPKQGAGRVIIMRAFLVYPTFLIVSNTVQFTPYFLGIVLVYVVLILYTIIQKQYVSNSQPKPNLLCFLTTEKTPNGIICVSDIT